jgi:aerobic-type carbon monoxide dehydrogenase small subunit (CoxS/CutS family)
MTSPKIDGAPYNVEAPEDTPLLSVLHDVLGMTDTKFGCGIAQRVHAPFTRVASLSDLASFLQV